MWIYQMTMEQETIQKVRLLPSWRFVISLTQCFGSLATYMNRININIAIVCMTEGSHLKNLNITGMEVANSSQISPQTVEAEFDWNRKVQSVILSSFYIGYVVIQIPTGWLLGKGKGSPKWFTFAGSGITIFLGYLSPAAARLHWGCLVVVQIMKGLTSGVFSPCRQVLIAAWAPRDERSRLTAISFSGASLGSIIGFLSAGALCQAGFAGWPSVFYIYAGIGTLWLVTWFFLVSDSPSNHPFIGAAEANYIHSDTWKGLQGGQKNSVPWNSMLRSPPLYAIWTVYFSYHWLWYTAQILLPTFINDVYKIDIKTSGFLISLPFLVNFIITILASWLADFLLKNFLSVVVVRKIMVTCQFLIPAIMVFTIGFTKNKFEVAVFCLTTAVGFAGFSRSGHFVNSIDLAPRYSGAIVAVGNTIGTIAAILVPLVAGALVPSGTASEWRNVFYLTAAICLFGNIIFVIFAKGEIQPWAKIEGLDEDVSENTKLRLMHKAH